MRPVHMRFGNCLIWALVQKIMRGGQIRMAKRSIKHRGWWPHFFWFDGHATWTFSPRARVGDGKGIDTILFYEGIAHRVFKGMGK